MISVEYKIQEGLWDLFYTCNNTNDWDTKRVLSMQSASWRFKGIPDFEKLGHPAS